ncbi:MAG: hypothetical protein JO322_03435 [Candidatus Eremiobacteraeota bacterium]|nr:hypothetical protein [Candidatus Eremiobacteraeota bacterium]
MKRVFSVIAVLAALIAAAPRTAAPIDSQIALERYELEMSSLKRPKAMIFTYTVSQAGANSIEQRHQVYRSGEDVRDETLAVDGTSLTQKLVTIAKRPDRYDVSRVAPRSAAYTMLFLRSVRDGSHFDYMYEARPLIPSDTGFVVTNVTIDGQTYLPRTIVFRAAAGTTTGTGELQYGKSGGFWLPFVASVEADVKGKTTRERILWTDYRFPRSLPPSTFVGPKPRPQPTLPAV